MGEKQNQPFRLSSYASLRVDFQVSRVTSEGLSLPSGELEEGAAGGGEGGVPLCGVVPPESDSS